jgi:ADP-ribosylglycohydrolase
MLDPYRTRGALLGLALGDALGAPVDGMSHQNVRTHYRGVKGLMDDEKRRDLAAGQWTAHTQRALALTRALAGAPADVDGIFHRGLAKMALRRADAGAGVAGAACAAPVGIVAVNRGLDNAALAALLASTLGPIVAEPESLAAAVGQARAIAAALTCDPNGLDGQEFVRAIARATAAVPGASAVPGRLQALAEHLDETPLDLQDRCGGTGAAPDEAFPFAIAMFARGPALVEATLLSAVNAGGAAGAVGAMVGALLGAANGRSAFPADWRAGLEEAGSLARTVDVLTPVP